MMAEPVKGHSTFEAYAYRPYSPGFEAPLGAGHRAGAD